jgi:hypothetical protein
MCLLLLLLQEVQHGIPPQAALAVMTQQLEQAGGSFKQLCKQQAAAAAAAVPSKLPGQLVIERSSSSQNTGTAEKVLARRGTSVGSAGSMGIAAHPLMNISALRVSDADP